MHNFLKAPNKSVVAEKPVPSTPSKKTTNGDNKSATNPATAAASAPAPAAEKTEKKEEENKIEIMKDNTGLGFSIMGGSDTTLVILQN